MGGELVLLAPVALLAAHHNDGANEHDEDDDADDDADDAAGAALLLVVGAGGVGGGRGGGGGLADGGAHVADLEVTLATVVVEGGVGLLQPVGGVAGGGDEGLGVVVHVQHVEVNDEGAEADVEDGDLLVELDGEVSLEGLLQGRDLGGGGDDVGPVAGEAEGAEVLGGSDAHLVVVGGAATGLVGPGAGLVLAGAVEGGVGVVGGEGGVDDAHVEGVSPGAALAVLEGDGGLLVQAADVGAGAGVEAEAVVEGSHGGAGLGLVVVLTADALAEGGVAEVDAAAVGTLQVVEGLDHLGGGAHEVVGGGDQGHEERDGDKELHYLGCNGQ
eukprot:129960_1